MHMLLHAHRQPLLCGAACCHVQAAAPAISYWLAVLMQQEDATWTQSFMAVLVFCSTAAALLPHRAQLSTAGLALQGSAVLLDTLWQRLHLRAVNNSNSSSPASTSTSTNPVSGLVLLADASPAAVVLLLPALLKFDLWQWRVAQYHMHSLMPLAVVACMFVCCLMVLKAQPSVLQGLVMEPSGPLLRVLRDGLLGLAAAKLLNEHLTSLQWLAYTVAQFAAMALWASSSPTCGGILSSRRLGFTKLPPVLG